MERLYLPEIAKGLVLTSRHFFRNMTCIPPQAGPGQGNDAMVTISYPEVRRAFPLVARSRIV